MSARSAHLRIRSVKYNQGFWIYLYFRIRHSFAHLRPVILSADWSMRTWGRWYCLQIGQSADCKVGLVQSSDCRWICKNYAEYCYRNSATVRRLVQSPTFAIDNFLCTAIYVVKVYECHPLDIIKTIIDRFETYLPLWWLPLYRTVGRIHGWNHNARLTTRSCPPTLNVFIEVIWAYNLLWVLNESEFWSWKSGENFWTSCHKNLILTHLLKYLST